MKLCLSLFSRRKSPLMKFYIALSGGKRKQVKLI